MTARSFDETDDGREVELRVEAKTIDQVTRLPRESPTWIADGLSRLLDHMDGITVMGFASVNDVEDDLTAEDYRAIQADETILADASRSEFWSCLRITEHRTLDRGAA